MRVERQDAPDRPSLAIVAQRLGGHRDRLGPVGRAGGQREHQHLGARAEQGIQVALADAIDVRLVALVAADRHASAEIGRGADLAEMVVAAELAVGVPGDPPQEQLALDVGGPVGLGQKRSGPGGGARFATGAPIIRMKDIDHDVRSPELPSA